MNTELKRVIVNFILDNKTEFQLINMTTNNFKAYIYDANGNYLIGGEIVSKFINDFIKIA